MDTPTDWSDPQFLPPCGSPPPVQLRPRIAFAVLQSAFRHLWYLVPQLVILALADRDLEDGTKEEMGKKLHSSERKVIMSGSQCFLSFPGGRKGQA